LLLSWLAVVTMSTSGGYVENNILYAVLFFGLFGLFVWLIVTDKKGKS